MDMGRYFKTTRSRRENRCLEMERHALVPVLIAAVGKGWTAFTPYSNSFRPSRCRPENLVWSPVRVIIRGR